MPKKIFIVYGHHNTKKSFNQAIRDTFVNEAKKLGHDIDLINLHDEKVIPFYDGSEPNEQILNYRKRLLLEDTIKTNETNVASAWSSLEASKGFLNSVRAQVRAANIAFEGISAEYERGSRTTLDVIQSNSLLLSAQISLANSERNYLLSQYSLLKAAGLLNKEYLNCLLYTSPSPRDS